MVEVTDHEVTDHEHAGLGLGAADPVAPSGGVFGLPVSDLASLAYVVGLIIVWGPGLLMGMVTPKLAILLIGLGPGLVVLAGLVRGRDRATRWLVAYLAWALVCALSSGAVRISVLGGFGLDRGWVVLVGYASAWALGRRLGPAGRRRLPAALLFGFALAALAGTFQAALDPIGAFAMLDGRANGLAQSSIYFGGQMGGALVLVAAVTARAGRRWYVGLPGAVLFTLAANLSGSRSALVVAALVALAAVLRLGVGRPEGPAMVVRLVAVAVAITCGLLASTFFDLSGASSARLEGGGGGGFQPRVTMWEAGLHATAQRPLTGWGPGRFRAATSSRVTAEFARAEGPDRLFFDAHNVVVEHLTTTGIVGLLLLLGFALAVGRSARGVLAWFGAAMVALWLLSPVSVATGPVALFALGAAAPALAPSLGAAKRQGAGRVIGAGLVVLALLASGAMVIADHAADQASRTGSVEQARKAQRFMPPDDTLADLEAQAQGRIAGVGPALGPRRAALAAAHRPIELDPSRPTWWVHLGYAEAALGSGGKTASLNRAEAAFRQALDRNPWSAEALDAMVRVAVAREDEVAAARWKSRLCQVVRCQP